MTITTWYNVDTCETLTTDELCARMCDIYPNLDYNAMQLMCKAGSAIAKWVKYEGDKEDFNKIANLVKNFKIVENN